jgi:fucose 4-O-acetylase-like acetyltransferase
MAITPQNRLSSVDALKGIAITLVVLGHVLQGVVRRGWWTAPSAIYLDHFLYSFHVQAFFFASGLFVSQSIARRGSVAFITSKLRTILYPYLLLNLVAIALSPFIARFQQRPPISPRDGLIAITNGDLSWFLYTLFFILMLALALEKIPIALRLVFALLLSTFAPNTGHGAIDAICLDYIFLVAGQMVGTNIAKLGKIPLWSSVLGTLLIFSLQAAIILFYGISDLPKLLFVPLGLLGTLGLLLAVRSVSGLQIERVAAWTGVASLGIFLLHPYFQGLAREAVSRGLHTHNPAPQLILVTLVATLLPAYIYHQRKRWKLTLLFEWPEMSPSK